MKQHPSYIKKHRHYIDYRIGLIYEEISQAEDREKSLRFFVETLISDHPHNTQQRRPHGGSSPIEDLQQLLARWNILQDGDLAGYIYQELQSKCQKKTKGQFFTCDEIVDFIVSSSIKRLEQPSLKILDPACGSGQFLLMLYRKLKEINNPDNESLPGKGISFELTGFDVDPLAVKIASYNLSRIPGLPKRAVTIHHADFLSLSLSADRTLPEFDLIIGNPPWRSRFSAEDKKIYRQNYVSIKSGLNTFTLFLEQSLRFLGKDGLIAFLLPEAYLNIKTHSSSRQYLLSQCSIKEISIWGDVFKGVFAPAISLILQKEAREENREKNIIQIRQKPLLENNTCTLVPQASYHATPENIFNIHYTRKSVSLINSIENQECLFLKDRAKFFLGIVTGDNDRFISRFKTDTHPDPIILGQDIQKYRISFSNHYFNFNRDPLQQVAPGHLYRTSPKILYKFIGRKLTFALDLEGRYSLNNVNGFIPGFNDINIESTLALLNSRLIQFFYDNCFFTVKVLRSNLERLPLKVLKKNNQAKIKNMVRYIMEDPDPAEQAISNIDDIIFHEYGIRDGQIEAFSGNSMIGSIESVKSAE